MPPKKKKIRKVKYYRADFKIPESTKKRLTGFCKKYDTTANKVFRRALREYLDRNHILYDHHDSRVSANQMSIFDLLES